MKSTCASREGFEVGAMNRLIRNNYQFTISERTTANLKEAMEQGNNILGQVQIHGFL